MALGAIKKKLNSRLALNKVTFYDITFHDLTVLSPSDPFKFLQRVSIACYAERCISHSKSVRPSVRLSVTRWH